MNKADLVNASFEMWGAVFQWLNAVRLLRDKKVAGVDWRVTVFHVSWGAWNIYFYQAMQAPWSAVAALCLLVANAFWVALALKYRRNK